MITYQTEETSFRLGSRRLTSRWIKEIVSQAEMRLGDLSVVFCSDPYILEVNKQYLGHDYYTDIITFDYCEGDVLSGDLIISVDTVRANAKEYGAASFDEELHRVIIHGVLHLIGFDDHSPEDQAEMRRQENAALALLKTLA
ncbi:MAG: rRNA maturation RNase YbeY [Bacteroidota bacterium]|nr:rRNA maturation RNase YbeY [Bacteroidota bacterium]